MGMSTFSLESFKTNYYFFKPEDFGRIFVFVDFGNVRYWAKELWPLENKYRISIEVDIAKLSEVCNWVNPGKKFFYYGFFEKREDLEFDHPLNKKYRKSIYRIDKAKKAGFEIESKEIKMIPLYDEDGKFIKKIGKCNFDVEITMDVLQKIEKYDTLMLLSGDSDFHKVLAYLKDKGKKIVIVSTRNFMSEELEGITDKFIPAESLAAFLKFELTNKTLRPNNGAEE